MVEKLDVIIVGAGFSGIYLLYNLRKRGFKAKIFEMGSDFGGTWHLNTYPGARVDSDIPVYEFSFDELYKGFSWTERFPGWRELQKYFHYVDSKLDLRKDTRFDSKVTVAHWDEKQDVWHVTTSGKGGEYHVDGQHVVFANGSTCKPYIPKYKDFDKFKGLWAHTGRWPKEGVDTVGKRVAVIGTGASGVQCIQEIGLEVAELTVFQRTPNLCLPMVQFPINDKAQKNFKPVYTDIFKKRDTTFGGFHYDFSEKNTADDTPEQRERFYQELWDQGGFTFWLATYKDMLFTREANDPAYAFWQKKTAARITDPVKREKLAPVKPIHPFGVKRPCLEQWYYEVYNRPEVTLVDTRETPIETFTEKGIRTVDGKEHEFDILILATGFDTHTGVLNDIDLRGKGGYSLKEKWSQGVNTYLGLTTVGFPNMFFLYGPHGPTAFCNGPTCAELQGDWIIDTIVNIRAKGQKTIEPEAKAEAEFKKHINALSDITLLPTAESWYMGANIPGKVREALNYSGGVPRYKREIREEIDKGYPNFIFT